MARQARIFSLGVVAIAALGLTACTGTPDQPAAQTAPVVQLGAPGEGNRTLSPDEVAAITSPPYIEADVQFLRDMLHHHSQAVIMTGYVADGTDDEEIELFAQRIAISQEDEMKLMEAWLQSKGEPVRDPDAAHDAHVGMPGLLTDAELASLEAARGKEFDVLFLQLMTKHHQGAVKMVTDLYAANGAQDVGIDQIAREVEADQNIELERMRQMLADRS